MGTWIQRLRERWKFVILGRDGSPAMVRYRLLDTRWGGLYVHHFLRSDQDRDLHDHPWHFTSLILWGGYVEELPDARRISDPRLQLRFDHGCAASQATSNPRRNPR